jgi:putative copper export protein/mono/diheme cytochrome c family protein
LFGWVVWPAAVLLVVLTLLARLVQASEVTGAPLGEVLGGRAITRLLGGTKYGALWLVRFGLALLLLGALAVATTGRRRSAAARRGRLAGAAVAAALMLALAATGHASGVPRLTALAVGADWVHLLAAAVWVGGLLQLLVVLPPVLAALDAPARRTVLASTIRRFSALAGASVALLVLTGTYAGVLHVPSWQALLDTAYGAALSGKLLLFAPLIGLAAINLLVLHPRFVRAARRPAAAGPAPDDAGGRRMFRLVVAGEVALAVLILGVTGVLSGLPPASGAPEGQPVRETRRVGNLEIALWLDPNRAGANSYRVQLTDAAGLPVLADRVSLELSHQSMDMGLRTVPMQAVGGGRYEAGGGQLSMSGPWAATVIVQRPQQNDVRAEFAVAVGEPVGARRTVFSPGRILLYSLTPQLALAGAVVALAGLLLAGQRRRPGRVRRPVVATAAALALIGVAAGGGAVAAGYRQSQAAVLPVVNPLTPAPETLAAGRLVYEQNCLVCHGEAGRGDGPAGRALRPPPADLRVHMAAGHTDAQLFEWVTRGVVGTAMPAFGERLSEVERWEVITYLRTFGAARPAPAASGAGAATPAPGGGGAP